jgi:hypothetical protein
MAVYFSLGHSPLDINDKVKTAQLPYLVQKFCSTCAVKNCSDIICPNNEFVFVPYIAIFPIKVADETIGHSTYIRMG